MGRVGEPELLDQPVGALLRRAAVQAAQAREQDQVAMSGELVVDRGGLADQPDPLADQGRFAFDVESRPGLAPPTS